MAYGTLAIDSITPTTTLSVTGGVSTGSIVSANTFGFKNRLINGAMRIAQRATSATITDGSTIAAGYSTVDRFYVYCTGANVTAAQVAGTTPILNNLQITGATSVTAIGVGQRIEAQNSADLAGQTATLSVNMSNSLLTTVTWTAYYATTTDTFGTLASPTRTQISTGSWTVTSTLTNYNAQISIPSAATTGIEIVLTVGAQISGTWVIGNVQLEAGSVATGFDYRSVTTELSMCQRYLPCLTSTTTGANAQILGYGSNYASTAGTAFIPFQVTPRVAPTAVTTIGTFKIAIPGVGTYTVSSITLDTPGNGGSVVNWTGSAMGLGTGGLQLASTNAQIQFTGCEL